MFLGLAYLVTRLRLIEENETPAPGSRPVARVAS
jgi:hypothetical protein